MQWSPGPYTPKQLEMWGRNKPCSFQEFGFWSTPYQPTIKHLIQVIVVHSALSLGVYVVSAVNFVMPEFLCDYVLLPQNLLPLLPSLLCQVLHRKDSSCQAEKCQLATEISWSRGVKSLFEWNSLNVIYWNWMNRLNLNFGDNILCLVLWVNSKEQNL